jgi:hypothetical protein
MKATLNTTSATFEPIELTLTFETQKEVDAFFGIMNYIPISDTVDILSDNGGFSANIRDALRRKMVKCMFSDVKSSVNKLI